MKVVEVNTRKRTEFIDITLKVLEVVRRENILDGFCLIYCPHTTAGLTINENADPCVKADILNHLKEVVPENKGYTHLEGNSDGHIKASLMGSSLNVLIQNNGLVLGTWQGIYFCEFDGPRQRKVYVKVIKG